MANTEMNFAHLSGPATDLADRDAGAYRALMPVGKRRPAITPDDVPFVFDDACIHELAAPAKLPPGADSKVFAAGVREAARTYSRDARARDDNKLHHEIAALYNAAHRRRYERLVALWKDLSPDARRYLENRLKRPGPIAAGLRFPTVEELRDPRRRGEACDMIRRLISIGGNYVEGRNRPSGKRSGPTLSPLLYAPAPRRHVSKRGPERNFVMNLETTWLEATGTKPSLTARHRDASRKVGPFARFARKCLDLVGVGHVDVVELINELNRRRVEKRRALIRRRREERARRVK
jgi:hypothetical protein